MRVKRRIFEKIVFFLEQIAQFTVVEPENNTPGHASIFRIPAKDD